MILGEMAPSAGGSVDYVNLLSNVQKYLNRTLFILVDIYLRLDL